MLAERTRSVAGFGEFAEAEPDGIDWRARALAAEAILRETQPWLLEPRARTPVDHGLYTVLPWVLFGMLAGVLLGLAI